MNIEKFGYGTGGDRPFLPEGTPAFRPELEMADANFTNRELIAWNLLNRK
jgi:hypothetical protein